MRVNLRTHGKEDKAELDKQLDAFRQELAQLRVATQTGGAASKLAKIRRVRKDIARILTVLNQRQKHELRKLYKGKKFRPLDLRAKYTKAKRNAQKPWEKNLKTLARKKQLDAFPVRKYALAI
eukprot:NODE_1236_length_576_cov_335.271347_g1162_i0.p1 GENE.NODE_1236_length_576_cov_335.271347_g1162_i0~~NODE_1236_length_576_cov_335.271347_g1162_i0.p1  ORF type:complete len:123 (-),score=41.83 NODE_1236_length_576_cov_335.271347_g1162_i0:111-479(-)